MVGKARFIFPVLATAVIVLVVSAVVTFANIDLRAGFVRRWLSAFIIGWPVAAVAAFIIGWPVAAVAAFTAFPLIRGATARIVALIEDK